MAGTRTIRVALWMALAGALTVSAAAEAKVKVVLAPNLSEYNVAKVAILGLANTTGDEDAQEMGTYVLTALSATGFYHFTTAEDFTEDAKRTGVPTEHARLLNTWLKRRKWDEAVVQKVLKATDFDAVIAMEVSRWEETRIDPTMEGTSDTSVGVLVQMIAADGTVLWSAKESTTEHSQPYLPQFNTRSTTSGQAVTTARGAVPEPPEVETVAQDLARMVVGTMPKVKRENAKGPAKDSDVAPPDTTGSPN